MLILLSGSDMVVFADWPAPYDVTYTPVTPPAHVYRSEHDWTMVSKTTRSTPGKER